MIKICKQCYNEFKTDNKIRVFCNKDCRYRFYASRIKVDFMNMIKQKRLRNRNKRIK